MQIEIKPSLTGRRAYALLITMVFLAVCLMVFASMMYWVSSNSTINQRNNQYNMSEAAAEAATERVLAVMMRDYQSQTLNTNASYYASLPLLETNYDGTLWPVQYTYSDQTGATGRISVLPGVVQSQLQPLGSEYANLQGFPWYWTNIATATPIGQRATVSATVQEVVNFSSIPIFQYAIFYNLNLEIDPGAAMVVNGPVWSNQGLWAGTANLTFNSTVSAVSNAVITATDPFATNKVDNTAPPNFVMAGQPSSGNTPLIMPVAGATNSNPTNVESILNIPPPTYAMGSDNAYSTNGQEFLANEADLIISNSPSGTNFGNFTPYGTNIFIYFQDPSKATHLTPLLSDFYIITNANLHTTFTTNYVSPTLLGAKTNIYYAGWSFATNVAFYDFRESDTVQALQIDVGLFNAWLTNTSPNGGSNYSSTCSSDKGHLIDSIWAYNSVPINNSTLPAVRVTDGKQLPSAWGFTVATPMPIYVWGDYNKQISSSQVSSGTDTTYTYPAALMGDAITVLSANWNDGNSFTTEKPGATSTILNAACLEGIVQSVPSINGNYSGGVENFLRFLETWSNITSTYNGSIVVMFPSIYATNYWSYGNYYTAPTRNWGFDYNFLQQAKLPPLTPQLKKVVRYSWAVNKN
jgi:hypothetical protein